MRNFKDLIARRRPTDPIEPQPAPVMPDTRPDEHRAIPSRVMTREALCKSAIDHDIGHKRALAARDYVPSPPRPASAERRDDRGERPRSNPAHAASVPVKRKVWDLEPEAAGSDPQRQARETAPMPATDPEAMPPLPEISTTQRKSRSQSSHRAKTRLLGFHGDAPVQDIFAMPAATGGMSEPTFPIGWIVVIDGPGRGASFTLTAGLSTVGRDANQTVSLDFGDTSISRENHVAIAYDEEDRRAYVGHGGKSNIVRLNDQPLLTTQDLKDGNTLRIGKTTLRFVAFCGDDFNWADADGTGPADA